MSELERLLGIMTRLRDPERGCPWDLEQSFESIAPYTIEEAYEVADAIARADMDDLRDELGDLLLQVVYHARIAEERALFDFEDVARAIAEKLVRRHPHVFDAPADRPIQAVRRTWEDTKAAERAARRARRELSGEGGDAGPFDDIPVALPALRRAAKILTRAERLAGPAADPVVGGGPIGEHLLRLAEAAVAAGSGADPSAQTDRIGDLLLAITALAAQSGVDPESALAARTRALESRLRTRAER